MRRGRGLRVASPFPSSPRPLSRIPRGKKIPWLLPRRPAMRLLMLSLCALVLVGRPLFADEKEEMIPGVGKVGPAVKLHTGFKFTEGPAADREGNVYFSDIPNERVHKVDTKGKLSTFREKTNRANGLMVASSGEIYACEGAGQVVAYSADGKKRRILADKYDDKKFNA